MLGQFAHSGPKESQERLTGERRLAHCKGRQCDLKEMIEFVVNGSVPITVLNKPEIRADLRFEPELFIIVPAPS